MAFFRLLAGIHECSNPDWEPAPNDPPDKKPPSRVYKAGDVLFDDSIVDGKNLAERFGHEKFQYLGEVLPQRPVRKPHHHIPTPHPVGEPPVEVAPADVEQVSEPVSPPPPTPNFDSMSQAELKRYAEAEEISLEGASSRADKVKRLKEAVLLRASNIASR